MTTPTIVIEVREDIERLRPMVTHVAHVDDVFWQVEAIIEQNPALHGDDVFRNWLGYCYTDSIVIGMRRLVDKRRDVASLVRALQKVKTHASDFRRDWFVGMSSEFLRAEAHGWFTEIVGGQHPRLPPERVQEWLDYLTTTAQQVEQFANDHVAHVALHAIGAPPTFRDVRSALVAAFRTLQWLIRLTSGAVLMTVVPVIPSNWLQPLRVAWLADQVAPAYEHLDDLVKTDQTAPL